MQSDPIVVAVTGALTTVVGLFYKSLLSRAEKAEREVAFWRDKYLGQRGMTDLALDEAERRATP